MSTIADPLCGELGRQLEMALNRPVRFVNDLPYAEREWLLETGEISLGWICGLLYVEKVRTMNFASRPVAAPVMQGVRYGDEPVYFADLIVHCDSPFRSWDDLRGARWVYNEEASYSGFHMLLAQMHQEGESREYFGSQIASGSHLDSMRMVRDGEADVAAIDSTVLDAALVDEPLLANNLRVVRAVGPRPMPPWVLAPHVPPAECEMVQKVLYTLHRTVSGAVALEQACMSRLAAVDDKWYDPIRQDIAYRGASSSV